MATENHFPVAGSYSNFYPTSLTTNMVKLSTNPNEVSYNLPYDISETGVDTNMIRALDGNKLAEEHRNKKSTALKLGPYNPDNLQDSLMFGLSQTICRNPYECATPDSVAQAVEPMSLKRRARQQFATKSPFMAPAAFAAKNGI